MKVPSRACSICHAQMAVVELKRMDGGSVAVTYRCGACRVSDLVIWRGIDPRDARPSDPRSAKPL